MKINPLSRLLSAFSVGKVNENWDKIETAITNTVSRDGSAPNEMEANFDMGGHRIINVGAPSDPTDVVRLQDITNIASGELNLSVAWADITDKPSTFTPSIHTHTTADITDFDEAVEDKLDAKIVAGSNITKSYNDTTGELTINATGDLAADWDTLVNKPSQFSPSAHTHPSTDITDFQEAVQDVMGSSLVSGSNVTVSYNDSTGQVTISSTAPSGGGDMYPNFVTDFGGVGDNSTNNDAALAAAEAHSGAQIIFVPEGRYKTSKTQAQLWDLTKRYVGPGVLIGTDKYKGQPQLTVYQDVHPVVSVPPLYDNGSGNYGLNDDMTTCDAKVMVIPTGTRRNFDRTLQTSGNPNGFSTYFWAPAAAHYDRYYIEQGAGHSGFSGLTTSTITAGVSTSVSIAGGVNGWQVGEVIGFASAMDGVVTETRTITNVNTGAGTISWSGPLSNTYAAGTAITHGYRTMNLVHLVRVEQYGHGDAYAWCARMTNGATLLDSQTSYEHGATVGIIGGDISFVSNGGYATGWECQYLDQGYDVGVIARVDSYIRQNEGGSRNCVWLHDYAKMDGGGLSFEAFGLKRIDGVYVAAVGAKVGLDLTLSSFTVAGIALPMGAKIGFNAENTGGNSTNGNGYIATTINDMYIVGASDSGGDYLYLKGGPSSVGLKIRDGNTVEAQAFHATGSITVDAGHVIRLGGVGSNTYLVYDPGSNIIAMYKNGVQVQTW